MRCEKLPMHGNIISQIELTTFLNNFIANADKRRISAKFLRDNLSRDMFLAQKFVGNKILKIFAISLFLFTQPRHYSYLSPRTCVGFARDEMHKSGVAHLQFRAISTGTTRGVFSITLLGL